MMLTALKRCQSMRAAPLRGLVMRHLREHRIGHSAVTCANAESYIRHNRTITQAHQATHLWMQWLARRQQRP